MQLKAELTNDGSTVLPVVSLGDELFVLHNMMGAHRNYVTGTWVNSATQKVKERYGVSTAAVKSFYFHAVDNALKSISVTTMTRPTGWENVVHAWVAHKDGVILWAYVPPELRKFGIFSALKEYVFCLSRKKNPQLRRVQLATLPKPHPSSPDHLSSILSASFSQ